MIKMTNFRYLNMSTNLHHKKNKVFSFPSNRIRLKMAGKEYKLRKTTTYLAIKQSKKKF